MRDKTGVRDTRRRRTDDARCSTEQAEEMDRRRKKKKNRQKAAKRKGSSRRATKVEKGRETISGSVGNARMAPSGCCRKNTADERFTREATALKPTLGVSTIRRAQCAAASAGWRPAAVLWGNGHELKDQWRWKGRRLLGNMKTMQGSLEFCRGLATGRCDSRLFPMLSMFNEDVCTTIHARLMTPLSGKE